jgi:hypothetical protein
MTLPEGAEPRPSQPVMTSTHGLLTQARTQTIAMQTIERPWGVAAYGAASVKAQPDLVRTRPPASGWGPCCTSTMSTRRGSASSDTAGTASAAQATPQDLAPGHVVVSAAVILGLSINNG